MRKLFASVRYGRGVFWNLSLLINLPFFQLMACLSTSMSSDWSLWTFHQFRSSLAPPPHVTSITQCHGHLFPSFSVSPSFWIVSRQVMWKCLCAKFSSFKLWVSTGILMDLLKKGVTEIVWMKMSRMIEIKPLSLCAHCVCVRWQGSPTKLKNVCAYCASLNNSVLKWLKWMRKVTNGMFC